MFDPKGKGFIHKKDLAKFLLELRSPLGLEPEDWNGLDLPFSYLASLELSLYNDLMEIQFYNLLERLARKALIDDLIAQEIEKMDKDKNFDRKKIDAFLNKFQTYSAQIQALEENKLNIHIVTEVQKVKKKYQGVGMFEIVTWREQQSLIKMTRAVKNRYYSIHGLAPKQNQEEKVNQNDLLKQPQAQNSQFETNRTIKALTQLDQSQEFSKREQEQQLERLMDSIVKEESEEEEEYKELRKLDVGLRANTNTRQNNTNSQKDRYVEPKNSTKTIVQATKASTDSKKKLLQKAGSAQKQPKNKQLDNENGSDHKTEMSKESDTIDPQKDEDIDFQSEGGRKQKNKEIEKKQAQEKKEKVGVKSSKNVVPKDKRMTIDNNIDQLEAEVAAILESEVSEQHMLEEEMLKEIKGNAKQEAKQTRKQVINEQSTQDAKHEAKAAKKS